MRQGFASWGCGEGYLVAEFCGLVGYIGRVTMAEAVMAKNILLGVTQM
jgi:hypothetical protein